MQDNVRVLWAVRGVTFLTERLVSLRFLRAGTLRSHEVSASTQRREILLCSFCFLFCFPARYKYNCRAVHSLTAVEIGKLSTLIVVAQMRSDGDSKLTVS